MKTITTFKIFRQISLIAVLLAGTLLKAQSPVPNGNFEMWSDTITAEYWNGLSVGSALGFLDDIYTLTRTTDAHSGNYAAKISNEQTATTAIIVTFPGIATLGYFDIHVLSGMIDVLGGVPFNERPSKLTGYYKYLPVGSDQMSIVVLLTKFNSTTGIRDTIGFGEMISDQAVNSYSAFELPIDYYVTNPSVLPDTLNIIFSSAMFFPDQGSVLYVDDLEFEYAVTGIEENDDNDIKVFPNPCNESINIDLMTNKMDKITLSDCLGNIVYQSNESDFPGIVRISTASIPSGIYILNLSENGRRAFARKIQVIHH